MRLKKIANKIIVVIISMMFVLDVYEAKTIKLMECELTEQYKQYLKLSEEEKKDVLIPPMCIMPGNLSSSPISSSLGSATAASFDLRTLNKVTPIKDQGETGSCWAFGTIGSMESNLLARNKGTFDFSEAHLELSLQNDSKIEPNSPYKTFNRNIDGGGNYFLSSAYLLNGYGPVLESDLNFSVLESIVGGTTTFKDSMLNKTRVLNPGEIEFIATNVSFFNSCSKTATSTTKIKNYLVTNGAIAATMNFSYMNFPFASPTIVQDATTGKYILQGDYINGPYYNYNGIESTNHAVTIVGWNDNISKDNFSSDNRPSSDGAWIVKNSWGVSQKELVLENGVSKEVVVPVGEDGYFYVSYEDKYVCSFLVGFYDFSESSDSSEPLEKAYYHDYLGYNNSHIIEDEDSAYVAAVYNKAAGNEKLTKVTTFFETEGIEYDIYLSDGDTKNLTTKIASGVSEHAGYDTIPITHNNIITSDKFTIIIKYNNFDGYIYIPVSIKIVDEEKPTFYDKYEAASGETYLSINGTTWADLATDYSQTAVVRGYTVPVSTSTTSTTTTTTTSRPTSPTTTTSSSSTTTTTTTKKEDLVPTPPNDDNDNDDIEVVPNPENEGITVVEENPKTKDINKDGAIYIVFVCLIFIGLATYKIYKLKTEKV